MIIYIYRSRQHLKRGPEWKPKEGFLIKKKKKRLERGRKMKREEARGNFK
jgi:hypothetical protein